MTIPVSVTSVGGFAFSYCSGLTSVTIPGSVTSIGSYAFIGCSGLISVTIPGSVNSIGSAAFSDCTRLTAITVDTANPNYSSLDGVLFNETQTGLIQCPGGKTGSYLIPASVTSIGAHAFYYCTRLTSVTIPNSVIGIGTRAFYSCAGLITLTIPESVTSIESAAFAACTSLTEIAVDPANPNFSSLSGVMFNKAQTILIQCPSGKTGSYAIPDSVTSIGSYAFDYCKRLTAMNISNSITSIADNAFYYCTGLASVNISASVSSIGYYAFYNCTGLTSVTIPSSLTDIGSYAFYYCTKLTGALFKGNAPTMGSSVFSNTASGFTVYYLNGSTGFTSPTWQGYPAAVGMTDGSIAFQPVPATIGSGSTATLSVTPIGTEPFTYQWYQGASGDTSMPVGTNSATFSTPALSATTSFWVRVSNSANPAGTDSSTVTVTVAPPPSVTTGPATWLTSSTATTLTGTVNPNGSATTLRFEYGLTTAYGTIRTVTLSPNNGITVQAVTNNLGTLPSGTTYHYRISATNAGGTTTGEDRTFVTSRTSGNYTYMTAATTATITGYTGAGGAVIIPSTLNGLTVTAIGYYAFYNKTAVTSVTIPSSVTNIGNAAFYAANSLTSAMFTGNAPSLGINVFGATPSGFVVYFYNGSTGFTSPTWQGYPAIGVDPPSSNANLASFIPSVGMLSPAFDPAVTTYSVTLQNAVDSIAVTPTVAGTGATVRVSGLAVPSGVASDPVGLNPGNNVITAVVTAEDGVTTKTYTITVSRAAPVLVTTEPAEVIDSTTAVLHGTVNPNGVATVFFEYGTTTAYGATTEGREISASTPTDFQADLGGLTGDTTYHYRAVAVSATGTVYGDDVSLTTTPDAPVAATGDPASVSNSGATLVGAVAPNGLATEVYFEYGLTELYGKSTPPQSIPAGEGIVDVLAPKGGLIENATYHYRIVASNSAGTAFGEDVEFQIKVGSGVENASPTAKPTVNTEGVAGVETQSAILLGSVNPNEGTTVVSFEFGTTTSYGRTSAVQGVGNGKTLAAVSLPADSLLPGTTYHYRLTASNSRGETTGADAVFTTRFAAPAAVTGDTEILTTTKARLNGTVRANGTDAEVVFDYGTDGITFPNSVSASPGSVSGNGNTPVTADLANLAQGVTYYYRVRAESGGGTGTGEAKSLEVASLSGLIQQFPDEVVSADRRGSVNVTLTPGGIGGGWRFAGERRGVCRQARHGFDQRRPGARIPPGGRLCPAVQRNGAGDQWPGGNLVRERLPAIGSDGSGALIVTLKPESLVVDTVPAASRAQWRLFGEDDAQWKDSGATVAGLVPGDYVIECKPVAGRTTPPPVTAHGRGWRRRRRPPSPIIWQEDAVGTPPEALAFETVSTQQDRPYAYVGQITSDVGSGSGFVVQAAGGGHGRARGV